MPKVVEVKLNIQASAYITDAIRELEIGIANIEAAAESDFHAAERSAPVRAELEKMREALALSDAGLGTVYFVGRQPD